MAQQPHELLESYTTALTGIFKSEPDKRQAHTKVRQILQDMSGDAPLLAAILRKHLAREGSLNQKHYPVVSIEIEHNPFYTLVANCWIPLPGRETHISTKAIHHHGNMLLTTATAFGPGYHHWTFQRPQELDHSRELYKLDLIENLPHPLHHIAFVDSHIAHLPMYPPDLTITFALWSNKHPTTWRDRLKRLPVMQANQAALRGLAVRAGLAGALDVKVVEYFDFYPTAEGFKGIRDRKEFERGPNTDYLFSLFHILQQTGNEDLAQIVEQRLESSDNVENRDLLQKLIRMLQAGEPIEGRLSEGHHGIPFANFKTEDIERALKAQAENGELLRAPGIAEAAARS